MFNILFAQTFGFIVNVLAGFTFLAVGWLYFDSWKNIKKIKTTLIRSIGFFIVSITYFISASKVDISLIENIFQFLNLIGYIVIFVSLVMEPVLIPPSKKNKGVKLNSVWLPPIIRVLLSPIIIAAIGGMYLIKATKGYEKQLKLAAVSFGVLYLSEILKIPMLFDSTKVVFWSNFLAEYQTLWFIMNFLKLLSIVILFVWLWGYLRFRIQAQIFITTLGVTVTTFIVVAISFSYLTLRGLEKDLSNSLRTNSRLFQYVIERLQTEALASAKTMASDSQVITGLINKDQNSLNKNIENISLSQKLDIASISDSKGIMVAGLNENEIGVDKNSEIIIEKSLNKVPFSTISIRSGSLYPQIIVTAASPIVSEDDVIGSATSGYFIDSAFIDGVKDVTGLDVSIFANDILTASTLIKKDGLSRQTGIKESNLEILEKVIENGETYVGNNVILNSTYYTAYEPLKSYNNKVIGMLSVIQPQSILIDNIEDALRDTFSVSVILIFSSVIPVYFLAKYIEKNVTA